MAVRARAEGELANVQSLTSKFLILVICVRTFHEGITTLARPNNQQCVHGSPGPAPILVFLLLLLDKLSRASEHQAEVLRECKRAVCTWPGRCRPRHTQSAHMAQTQLTSGHPSTDRHQPRATLGCTYLSPVMVMVKPSYSFP